MLESSQSDDRFLIDFFKVKKSKHGRHRRNRGEQVEKTERATKTGGCEDVDAL